MATQRLRSNLVLLSLMVVVAPNGSPVRRRIESLTICTGDQHILYETLDLNGRCSKKQNTMPYVQLTRDDLPIDELKFREMMGRRARSTVNCKPPLPEKHSKASSGSRSQPERKRSKELKMHARGTVKPGPNSQIRVLFLDQT